MQEGWRARYVDDGSEGTTHATRDGRKDGGEGRDAEGKPWWTDGRRLTRRWKRTTMHAGISRDKLHKRRSTGGKQNKWRKKRKYELGRTPAMTKLSSNVTVRRIRVRGGNFKFRALRLDAGNFSWPTEAVTRKTRVLNVVYNASNNELVRTQTLVKNCIVEIDAAPFRQWYEAHYGVAVGLKKKGAAAEETKEETKRSNHVQRKIEARQAKRHLDQALDDQFATGRLYACVSSRPGQSGRCDGYILEGKELEFYLKKMQKKKGKSNA